MEPNVQNTIKRGETLVYPDRKGSYVETIQLQ